MVPHPILNDMDAASKKPPASRMSADDLRNARAVWESGDLEPWKSICIGDLLDHIAALEEELDHQLDSNAIWATGPS